MVFISSIGTALPMGGDKVVSEIYAATLIALPCSFYFLVMVGQVA